MDHLQHFLDYECFFWLKKFNAKTLTTEIIIQQSTLIDFLDGQGFQIYPEKNGELVVVRVLDNLIYPIEMYELRHFIKNFIYKELDRGQAEKVYLAFIKGESTYLSPSKLQFLKICKPNILKDKHNEAYFFYENVWVTVKKDGIYPKTYEELPQAIWANQRQKRPFYLRTFPMEKIDAQSKHYTFLDLKEKPQEAKYYFIDFLAKICYVDGMDMDTWGLRFQTLQTVIGYLLHNFYDYKLKAICLTDATLSNEPSGRTGKTLFAKSMQYLRNYTEIAGKTFKPDYIHKYDKVKPDTQIININDLPDNIDFTVFFNDIAEGLEVVVKGKTAYNIQTKMVMSSNKTLRGTSDSHADRRVEFEVSRFFNKSNSPDKYYNCWFFREFDEESWLHYDNFMLSCVQAFLTIGLIEPPTINLDTRRLIDSTCSDFYSFAVEDENSKLKLDVEYEKEHLFEDFRKLYPDYNHDRFRRNTFSIWLKNFAHYAKWNMYSKRANKIDSLLFKSQQDQTLIEAKWKLEKSA